MKLSSILIALVVIFSCSAAHAMSDDDGQACEKSQPSIAVLDSAYNYLSDNLDKQDGDKFVDAMVAALHDSSGCDELFDKCAPIVAKYKKILDNYSSGNGSGNSNRNNNNENDPQ